MKKLSRQNESRRKQDLIDSPAKAAKSTSETAKRRCTGANDGAPLPLALGATVRVTNLTCNHTVACVSEASRNTSLAPISKVAKRCMDGIAIDRARNIDSARLGFGVAIAPTLAQRLLDRCFYQFEEPAA